MAGVHVYNDSFILDSRLSYKARGLLGYMLSQGKEWHVNVEKLIKDSDEDGRIAVQSGLKELLKYGYAKLLTDRDKLGRVCGKHWVIYSTPTDKQETRLSGNMPIGADKQETRLSGNMPIGENQKSDVDTSPHRQAGFPLDGKPDNHKTCSTLKNQDLENKETNQEKTKEKTQDKDLTHTPTLSSQAAHAPEEKNVYVMGRVSPEYDSTAALFNQARKDQATAVVRHLNAVTGRTHTKLTHIDMILDTGVTVEQCLLVIDWWKGVKIIEQPSQRSNFNATSPFKHEMFSEYLAFAIEWDRQGRPTPTPQQGQANTHRKPTGAQAVANFVKGGKR